MKKNYIVRMEGFDLNEFINNHEYKISRSELINADLLLVPYGKTKKNEYPTFMMGIYDLAKDFQEDHKDVKVQPIYGGSIRPCSIVFDDISIYLGSFILTSILAPIFVNWISKRFSGRKKDEGKVEIHININIYDKGDSFSTSFHHSGSIGDFSTEYLAKIKEYSELKQKGKTDQFDSRYLDRSVSKKA